MLELLSSLRPNLHRCISYCCQRDLVCLQVDLLRAVQETEQREDLLIIAKEEGDRFVRYATEQHEASPSAPSQTYTA